MCFRDYGKESIIPDEELEKVAGGNLNEDYRYSCQRCGARITQDNEVEIRDGALHHIGCGGIVWHSRKIKKIHPSI